MKYCKDCWNFDRCNAIGRTVDFPVDDGVCLEFDEIKAITNADRIRAMSDEELGRFLAEVENRRSAAGGGAIWKGGAHAIQWLKQPVEEI